MSRLLLALLLFALIPASVAAASQGDPVQVQILEPASGAQLGGPEVIFRLGVSGANLPLDGDQWTGKGLFHVLLDGTDVLQVNTLTFSLIGVTVGQHTVAVQLQGWTGGDSNIARTTMTVVPVARPDDTSWTLAPLVAVLAVVIFGGLLLMWLFWVRPRQAEPIYYDQDEEQAEEPGT